MNTRHIAFLGFTVSGFLAMALAGCSASDTPAKTTPKKDGGTSSTTATGAGGGSGTTTGAGGDTTGAGGAGVIVMTGSGGAAGGPDLTACTKPMPAAKALVAMDVLSDLEGDAPGAIMAVTPGGGWYSYKDPETGTTFTPDPASWMVETPGNGGTGSAVHVKGSGFMGPASATNWGAGTGFSLGGGTPGGLMSGSGMATTPTDLSAYTGISFMAKSSMMSDISVQFATPDTDPSYCTCATTGSCYSTHFALVTAVAADWTKYTVKFADLHQPMYGTPVAFDPTSVLTINFASNGPLAMFDYWLDDITLVK
jgi:hypothetical protein